MSQVPPSFGLLKKLLSGAFVVYGAGAALVLLSQLCLTRLLGVGQYGTYYYVLSWLMILVVLVKFGVDHAMLRFLPAYLSRHEWGAIAGMMQWATGLVIRSTTVVATVAVIAIFALLQDRQDLFITFLLGISVLPFWALGFLRQAALRALRRNVLAMMPELIVAPLLIIGIVGIVGIMGQVTSAALAMGATVFAFGVALLLGNRWLQIALPAGIRTAKPTQHIDKWAASAKALFIGGSMHLVMSNTDAVMLGMLVGTDVVGVYGVAARSAALVAFPLTIANTAFVPMIAEMLANGNGQDLERILRQGMKWVALAATAAAGVLFSSGHWILSLFGLGFEAGVPFMWILVVAQLVNALSGPVAYVVAYSGREALVAKVLVTAAGLNVLLNLLLVPRWGAMGAAIATGLCLAGWNIALYILACRHLSISAGIIRACGPKR